jgi:hypothetical protein
MQLMDKNIFGERFILNENNYSYEHIFNTIAHQLNVKPPTIKVTKLLSQLAWRAEGIKTLVTGKPSIVTKETAATSLLQCFYSNSKIIDAINYKFTPINKIIENTAKDFLATYKN